MFGGGIVGKDYSTIESILTDCRDASAGDYRPKYSADERVSAAKQILDDINLQVFRITNSYVTCLDMGVLKETSKRVYGMMRVMHVKNKLAYKALSLKDRIEKVAKEFLGRDVPFNEKLSKKQIRELFGLTYMVMEITILAVDEEPTKSIKTLNDLLKYIKKEDTRMVR